MIDASEKESIIEISELRVFALINKYSEIYDKIEWGCIFKTFFKYKFYLESPDGLIVYRFSCNMLYL